MTDLRKESTRKIIKPLVESYTFADGRSITILDQGKQLNVEESASHPSKSMAQLAMKHLLACIAL